MKEITITMSRYNELMRKEMLFDILKKKAEKASYISEDDSLIFSMVEVATEEDDF